MYDDHGEELFGHDGRHKPPRFVPMLTADNWGNSHGRVCYSQFCRTYESNYSEYALKSLGCVPKNYVIVNAKEVHYNPETALKVGHGRVAIPVKEFARQKRLTLLEQWELMNPRWVGTYFDYTGKYPYNNHRPNLKAAMNEAMEQGTFDEFMQQFWSAIYGHEKAINRLKNRAEELQRRADDLHDEYMTLNLQVKRVESDIHYQRYNQYHLQGYNLHEYLDELRDKRSDIAYEYNEARSKAYRIKNFINNITFYQQCGLE